ncbi:MAG: DUF2470 domain-containing protein [Acidimicrobiales bacterium]
MSHGRHHDPVEHVNENHADDLLAAARAFGGHPAATAARAERIDRDGMDLLVDSPTGPAEVRVRFTEPVDDAAADGLRIAFTHLAREARAALTEEGSNQ